MIHPNINVLINGGGNSYKSALKDLTKLQPFQKIYVFEPNPIFHDEYQSDVILVKKAIWTHNGILPFYLSRDERQVASSLLEEKLCKVNGGIQPYWHNSPLQVECVDLSEWIVENIKHTEKITLKLDIEGAEYDVLWKMIQNKTIERIEKLFVEFHLETIPSKKQMHEKLIVALKECNVTPLHWD
jgi:FkbM family methyltransferase